MMRSLRALQVSALAGLTAIALTACASTPAAQPTAAAQPTGAPAYAPPATAAPAAAAPAKLNLNEVSGEQLLATIPGFSSRMVREFLEYRPYISIQQFRQELGKYVSAEQVAQYEQYVYVPISVDESDAATLQQLPGLDEAAANELIAGRPYGSNAAFLSKLATYVSAADLAAAEQYLAAN